MIGVRGYCCRKLWKALDLYKRASGNGCIEATVDLGNLYAEGLGVKKNGKRALELMIARK